MRILVICLVILLGGCTEQRPTKHIQVATEQTHNLAMSDHLLRLEDQNFKLRTLISQFTYHLSHNDTSIIVVTKSPEVTRLEGDDLSDFVVQLNDVK